MNTTSRSVPLVACLVLVGACASSPPPPAAAPSPAETAAGPSSAAEAAKAKASMRDAFCQQGSMMRECLAIPDAETCAAAFDEAWEPCTKGIVIHEGPSEEDRQAGAKAGSCMGRVIAESFPGKTESEGCKKALRAAQQQP